MATDLRNSRMCLSKTVFWSLYFAELSIAKIRRKGGPKMRPYLCPNCLQYHLARVEKLTKKTKAS